MLYNDAKPTPITASSGEPQGCHIGPILFLLFLMMSILLLFADDLNFLGVIGY